ncbi:MAG: peptide deformylase [Lachnospiraceae bacterium]|nr:peptide deformylase [Lachnospiraceae bacterium]MBQ6242598.1 peptide deformylase [Lachnospiraceae bacterium]
MSIRNIRVLEEDEILRKTAKPVKEMTARTFTLIQDMKETMYAANGVGLAAPQVGVLKRIFVVDCDQEDGRQNPIVFINPEILEQSEETVTDNEGCLSVPNRHALVTRPEKVKVTALNEQMEPFTLEAEGLLARCICHENDHLNGVMYVDKAEGPVEQNTKENGWA